MPPAKLQRTIPYDPDEVSVTYGGIPVPVTCGGSATTDEGAGDVLRGLPQMFWALRCSAEMPGVLVHVDRDLGGDAVDAVRDRCGSHPRVQIDAEFLRTASGASLWGTYAHEVAHITLEHPGRRQLVWLERIRNGCGAFTLLSALAIIMRLVPVWATDISVWACLSGLVLLAGAHLLLSRTQRLDEYDADYNGAILLDQAQLPGTLTMLTMLEQHAHESNWYRHVGWIFDRYPPNAARQRALRTGHPIARWDWSDVGKCPDTGQWLGTRAHRKLHGPGSRCDPRRWRLLPSYRPPTY